MRNVRIQSYSGDFNSPFSVIDGTTGLKASKGIEEVKHTIDQQELIDIYRIFTQQHRTDIFFKCSWNSHQDRPYTGS